MRFRCNLCSKPPRLFEWEDNAGICPQCNASGVPHVATLIDVHLIVMDAKGPISSSRGRQLVGCQPARAYLARTPWEPFAASDDPRAVTCPKCRRLPAWREQAALYEELEEALAESKHPAKTIASAEAKTPVPPPTERVQKPKVEKGAGAAG